MQGGSPHGDRLVSVSKKTIKWQQEFGNRTYGLLHFIKFNTKSSSKSITPIVKCVSLWHKSFKLAKDKFKNQRIMTQEQEAEVLRLIKDIDVTELMDMLIKHGNRYSRRILKFFRWFCKYVPITLMCFHAYGIMNSLSILVKCSFLMRRIHLAISTYISWFTSCQWF